eukprot:Phypoly_transcript_06143.p1 GENE.Phypoly_transcript_06143~~Phypoly_transcript_06143.p1  ORF type:complete len:505 (+),score=59.58 Phypoly_transcript_06143:325-1839(+)
MGHHTDSEPLMEEESSSTAILHSSSSDQTPGGEEEGVLVVNGWIRKEGEGQGDTRLMGEDKKEERGEDSEEDSEEEKEVEPANKGIVPWLALLVLCMCPLGGYLAYDVPGALNISLREDRGLTLTQIGALYTAYAIPTVISSPFCGFIIQMFGSHRLLIVCNALLTLGSLGFAFADSYELMLLTRILFGTGAEVLFVAVSLQIEQWFRHSKHMAVAFGACSCFPLIGTIGAFAALPPISKLWSLRGSLLVAAAFVAFSTVTSVIYALFLHPHLKFATEAERKTEKVTMASIAKSTRGIPKEFWLLSFFVFSIYTTGFSFLAVAGRFFNEKYGFSDIYSSWLMVIFSAVACVFGPMLTFVLDKFKKRVTVGIIAGLLNASIYFIFGFTFLHPAYVLVAAAIIFVSGSTTTLCLTSQFASGKDIGVLFSVLSVFQNLTFLTMPVVFGAIRDSTGGYEWSCLFFAVVSLLGALCLVVLRLMKIGESLDAGPTPKTHRHVELVKIESK